MYNHSNLVKGYNYERRIWDILDLSGIDYEGNPIIFEQWKKYTNKGYDIQVSLNAYLRVECKFTSKPIFHSWFMRDWYSRDCDIIVTNNVSNVPCEGRELLKKKGIELLETYQFCHYLKELKNAIYGNKYVIFEYGNFSLFNGVKKRIRGKGKKRLREIRKYVKTRLKRLCDFIKFMFWLEYEIKILGDDIVYKTKVFLLPIIETLNPVGNLFLFTVWNEQSIEIDRHWVEINNDEVELSLNTLNKNLRKKRKLWISKLTPNIFEYLRNLEYRLKRINTNHKRFCSSETKDASEVKDEKIPDYSPEDFVPILDGCSLDQSSREQREAYLKQCEMKSYYVWR